MPASLITAFTPIAENSEATPGLFNARLQQLQDNIVSSYSLLAPVSSNTWQPESGNTANVLNGKSLILKSIDSGGAHFNVLAFGAVPDGVTSVSAAVQLASHAANAVGGADIYFPVGRYYFGSAVTLGSKTRIVGEGVGSVLVAGLNDYLSATSQTDLAVAHLRVESDNARLLFTRCQRVRVEDVFFDGFRSNNDLAGQAVWSNGCTGLEVVDCTLKDFNDAIYLDLSGTTVSDDVVVRGCRIYHDNHGTFWSYPVGVYAFNVGSVLVSECIFRNIYYGNAVADAMGYGVYEGDGIAGDVAVANCTFESTGTAPAHMTGVLVSRCTTARIIDNKFKGSFQAITGAAADTIIADNTFDGAYVSTQQESGGPAEYFGQTITGNSFRNCTTAQPLIVMNVGSPNLDRALIANNHFYGGLYGAMFLRNVNYADVIGNQIYDCNTSNDTNDWQRGGINFFGCTAGFVGGNVIINTSSGRMHYGVVSGAAAHSITIADTNVIKGMTLGTCLRHLTAAPTVGSWSRGQVLHYWDASASAVPGIVCTQTGTYSSATSATGNTSNGSAVITNVISPSSFATGDYVTISAGFPAGAYPVFGKTANSLTLGITATSSATTVTITAQQPIWKSLATTMA